MKIKVQQVGDKIRFYETEFLYIEPPVPYLYWCEDSIQKTLENVFGNLDGVYKVESSVLGTYWEKKI